MSVQESEQAIKTTQSPNNPVLQTYIVHNIFLNQKYHKTIMLWNITTI